MECNTNSIPVGYLPWVWVWVDPRVHSQQPMAVPMPLWVWVINGYGSGYGKKYPGVTHADHYSTLPSPLHLLSQSPMLHPLGLSNEFRKMSPPKSHQTP